MNEIAELVPGTAEAPENLTARVIENMNGFVAAIHDKHISLLRIAGKSHPPRSAARIRKIGRAGSDPNVALKLSHFVEHLDSIALPVAYINQPVISDRDAVNDSRKHAFRPSSRLFGCGLAAPLAQEFSGLIEYRDAPIAIPVRDVDIPVARVDGNSGGIEEMLRAGVLQFALAGSIRGVENSTRPNLVQQLAVVSVFLNNTVVVATHPNIVVLIESATMDGIWNGVGIAPGRDDVAALVEHDDRRRLLGCLGFLGRDVATIDDHDVIVCIGANAS